MSLYMQESAQSCMRLLDRITEKYCGRDFERRPAGGPGLCRRAKDYRRNLATPQLVARVLRLLRTGLSQARVAQLCDVSQGTVSKIARRHGLGKYGHAR